jgi:hypothetical protein
MPLNTSKEDRDRNTSKEDEEAKSSHRRLIFGEENWIISLEVIEECIERSKSSVENSRSCEDCRI